MTRFAVLALALVLLCARVEAQPASFSIIEVKVVKDKIEWPVTEAVPVSKEVAVEVDVNGRKIVEKRVVTVHELVQKQQMREVKNLKATDAAGKAIAAEKLAELLKETTPVVLVTGSISEKQRKLFKDTTIFIEQETPKPVMVPAVPVPPVASPAAPPIPPPAPPKP